MPSWSDLKRFCQKDKWELYKESDHYFYRKRNNDGVLRHTKVSKGSGEIERGLWKRILNKQLIVTQEYFNKHS